MADEAKPDFSGYVTKYGLKCSDGRTIKSPAFQHQDKETVPMVWQHGHNEPSNVLGHMKLEHRDDGVYAYGFFNETDQAKNARTLVQHGDIKSLSIYANQLTEKAKQVIHGFIREASLVLSGANPGALIDNITLAHADGDMVTLEDEAIIYTGLELNHADAASQDDPEDPGDIEDDVESSKTVQEVYDSMTPEQQAVCHYMVGAALEGESGDSEGSVAQSSDEESGKELVHDDKNKEGRRMSRNVFEQGGDKREDERHTLSHDAMKEIFANAKRLGSLKHAVEEYAIEHSITNIDLLFPEYQSVTNPPEFDKRRTEWVQSVLSGTRKSPFTRIKSLSADLTPDAARAKGYVTGTLKVEEVIAAAKRTTAPTTVYKKQKLDRDDILDITDFDVVVWLQGEMRLMLDEELARAILVGDGRTVADPDKILDPAGANSGDGIRSIFHDAAPYVHSVNIDNTAAGWTTNDIIDQVMLAMPYYKGTGSPTLYTTIHIINDIMLKRDTLGRRIYGSVSDIAAEMGVSAIVPCEALEATPNLVGILVNLTDYTIGTDKGGQVNFFDFFDIDYNQYKYLLETRCSGALTKLRSAVVFTSTAAVVPASAEGEPKKVSHSSEKAPRE
jgi:HK97 family phage prohead protease